MISTSTGGEIEFRLRDVMGLNHVYSRPLLQESILGLITLDKLREKT